MHEPLGAIPIILGIIVFIFFIYVWFRIFVKAGYSGWLGILMVIPIVNLIMILVLAFSEWPIEKRLKQSGQ